MIRATFAVINRAVFNERVEQSMLHKFGAASGSRIRIVALKERLPRR